MKKYFYDSATTEMSINSHQEVNNKFSYEFTEEEFQDKLNAKLDEKSSIVFIYKSNKLKIQYGFIKKPLADGNCELTCYTECDSILIKNIVQFGQSWILKDSDEVSSTIEDVKKQIEESEAEFSKPCSNTFLYWRPYFANPSSFTTWKPTFFDIKAIVRAILSKEKRPRFPSEEELEEKIPVVRPPKFSVEEKGLALTWLGHACVLVRLNGINIITDPVFSKRASPIQFAGPKRLTGLPCEVEELPQIDVVFISHDHYDHLDIDSITKISEKYPSAHWFVPLGIANLLPQEIDPDNVHSLSWGDKHDLVLPTGKTASITCVPAQHWGSRTFLDIYSRLWSGWVITDGDKSFYFAGDTGFCKKEFLKIGHHFENGITLAAIPIGCYEPSAFMHPQHISPREAVAVHKMIKAKKSVAIHWGTYDMKSTEGFFGPIEDLKEAIEEGQLAKDEFIVISPGETIS